MKIIANHAHLMPNPKKSEMGRWPFGDVSLLMRYLDHNNIEKAVVFPPYACRFKNNTKDANLWAIKQIKKYRDRLIPAGTIFPLASDVIDVLKYLNDEGVKLIKIHPSNELYDVNDSAANSFYEKASELGLILDFHTGPHGTKLSLAKPEKFDEIVWKYPKLSFIFEHLGGRTYFEEFLAIIYNQSMVNKNIIPRVYGGLTSILDFEKQKMLYIGKEKMLEAINIVGADKFIFGLDFPYNSIEDVGNEINTIQNFSIPESDIANILGGNLSKLLAL